MKNRTWFIKFSLTLWVSFSPVLVFATKLTNPSFNTSGDIAAEANAIGGKIAAALYVVAGILALFGYIKCGMKYMDGEGDEGYKIGKNTTIGAFVVLIAGALTQIFT